MSVWEKLFDITWTEAFFYLAVLLIIVGVVDAFVIDVDLYGHVWRFLEGFIVEMAKLFHEVTGAI